MIVINILSFTNSSDRIQFHPELRNRKQTGVPRISITNENRGDQMDFSAFFACSVITAFTPGPNNIMAMTASIKHGFGKAAVFCAGVFWGFIIDMTLCALATSYLYGHLPVIEQPMRWLGAAYILYLAIMVYRDKGGDKETETTESPAGFFTGVVMQLVNIKVILYGITAMSTFVLPHYKTPGALAVFILLLSVIGFAGTVCWALFGSLFQRYFISHRKPLNIAMSLLLVYCAVRIIV